MKTVLCIDDDFTGELPEWSKNALMVGEEFPMKGKIYTVEHEVHFMDHGVVGYHLEGLDFSNYGANAGIFKDSRFEIISDVFTPTYYIPELNSAGECFTIVASYKL